MKTQASSDLSVAKQAKAIAHEGLEERALNVVLHLRMWNGRRLDRRTTSEVLSERSAAPDAGKFEKNLVPPTALEAVNKAHSRARARHYRLTLPWDENGVRIISAAAFFEYNTAMDEERGTCEKAYQDFCAAYPRYVTEAPKRMAKLYEINDFPQAKDIAEKFGFDLKLQPVPNKSDFRVDLGAEMQRRIEKSIEDTVTERYAAAQRDLWERLLDTVKHFAVTMADDEKTYRSSTVQKLADLARLAPKLSLTPDPKLDAICAEVLAITGTAEPGEFRENMTLRRESAARAKAALDKIEASMKGAFV
jgi:hypothetical protein